MYIQMYLTTSHPNSNPSIVLVLIASPQVWTGLRKSLYLRSRILKSCPQVFQCNCRATSGWIKLCLVFVFFWSADPSNAINPNTWMGCSNAKQARRRLPIPGYPCMCMIYHACPHFTVVKAYVPFRCLMQAGLKRQFYLQARNYWNVFQCHLEIQQTGLQMPAIDQRCPFFLKSLLQNIWCIGREAAAAAGLDRRLCSYGTDTVTVAGINGPTRTAELT